jgi:hypothetical protein
MPICQHQERTKKPLDLYLALETPGSLPAALNHALLRTSFSKLPCWFHSHRIQRDFVH